MPWRALCPNIGGPKQPRRALLSTVVTSVILYGAPIWAEAMSSHTSYGATCRRAYRVAALRVARAYRTVSDIAGLPPVDLLATERAIKCLKAGMPKKTTGDRVAALPNCPGGQVKSGSVDGT